MVSFEDRGLVSLVEQIKRASANIADGDARMNQRIDELAQSVNELYLKANRPGAGWESKDDNTFEKKMRSDFVRTAAPWRCQRSTPAWSITTRPRAARSTRR